MSTTIYHGSNTEVRKPKILTSGYTKDFGFGFYCTCIENQAIRWALTRRNKHIVNTYLYEPDSTLKILSFDRMTDEWLDFIADCRHGKKHSFDIVEGPMADDEIWDYVEDFLDGKIDRDAFWELAKFKHPTHQIVFCTQKALETVTFVNSKEYEEQVLP